MPYKIKCANPACGRSFLIPRTALLQAVSCGHCGYRFVVRPKPAPDPPAADSQETFDFELASLLEFEDPDEPASASTPAPSSQRPGSRPGLARNQPRHRSTPNRTAEGPPAAASPGAQAAAESPAVRARAGFKKRLPRKNPLTVAVLSFIAAGVRMLMSPLRYLHHVRRDSRGRHIQEKKTPQQQGEPQSDLRSWEQEFLRVWKEKSQTWKRR